MSTQFWQGIAETPWWLYLLIVYLFHTAYYASKPRQSSLRQLIWLTIAAIISVISLVILQYTTLTLLNTSLIFICGLFGLALGWIQFSYHNIQASNTSPITFTVPGTWLYFIIYTTLLILYFTNKPLVTNLISQENYSKIISIMLTIYSLTSGLLIGKCCYIYRHINHAR